MTMREITFEEVRRLIPERFAPPKMGKHRTRAEVYREYNDDKYATLQNAGSFEEALARYRGPVSDIVVSRHGRFFVMPSNEAFAMREGLIIEAVAPLMDGIETIVELGAGFGQTLATIRRVYSSLNYIAGEFSEKARNLGTRLLPGIQFVPFDFYDETWPLFNDAQKMLVVSFHAIEMVPDAAMVAQKLHHYGIRTISLFEPIYETGEDPVLAERRKYIERHDYCRNILQSFQPVEVERDFFGLNPLFPEARLTLHAIPPNGPTPSGRLV